MSSLPPPSAETTSKQAKQNTEALAAAGGAQATPRVQCPAQCAGPAGPLAGARVGHSEGVPELPAV